MKVEKYTDQKSEFKQSSERNFVELIYSCGCCYSEFFGLYLFGVEFYLLYRNSEEAFRSRHIHLIGIGITIPNRHICSVGTGKIILNRHIRSPNRYIYRPKWIVPEQTNHSVGTDAIVSNRHVCSLN